MSNPLTWCDLPDDISLWPALPLSLNGDEIMPLDYHAGRSGWLLYGKGLDKLHLTRFQRALVVPMVIVSAWCAGDYQVVRLAGSLTARAAKLAHSQRLDVAPLGKIPTLRSPGLLVMDMDSTAIQIECIDEIARIVGCGEEVAEVTKRAMRGEIDFATSLTQRVEMLEGVDVSVLHQVRESLPLTHGVTELVANLRAYGWYVAIVSGGFSWFADVLLERLELSAAVANQLEITGGKLTGKLTGDIVDARYKADTLTNLATQFSVVKEQTVAVGDGANDLLMLKGAALGIAWHAKPKVNERAEVSIHHADLMGVWAILSCTLNTDER